MTLRPLAALWITACAASVDAPVDDTDATSAPRWPACDPSATTQTVSFVHMNDMHGHYDVDDAGVANVSRIRQRFEDVRAENPFTLFTNGGDDYEKGSVIEALSAYKSTREVSEALQFDVRVIGNHDLAWSQEELLAYTRDPFATVLASNIDYIGEDATGYGAVEYAEFDVGCLRVGFVGAVSAPWDEENTQYEGDYYPEFPTDLDFVETHRRLLAEHRADVDLFVAVSHLGLGDDTLVAMQTDGIDVILGGHSHSVLLQPDVVGETIVVQAGSYAQYVALLDVDVDLAAKRVTDHRYELSLVTTDMPPQVETQAEIDAILHRYGPDVGDPVATLVDGVSKLGAARLAADGALATLGVDAAAIKESAAFGGIPDGPVTDQDLFEAFLIERQPAGTPGWTATYTVTIAGDDLARFTELDPTQWAVSLPASIDPEATYTVALPKFAALNPASYLPAGVEISDPTFAKETWEVLAAYARSRTTACLHLDRDVALTGCP